MSNAESNTPENQGLDAAVDSIAALLGPDDDTPDEGEPQQQVAEQDDDSSDDAQETTSDEPEQGGDDESDKAEDHESDTLEEVEFDGKKAKIPTWLKPALLRQQDYTRKTQELAEQRKQVDSVRQQTTQQQQQYVYGLQVLQQAMQQFMPQPPPQQLWDDDPVEAMRQQHRYQQQIERLNAVEAAKQREFAQQQQQQQAQQQEILAQAHARLTDFVPAWSDPKKAETERPQVRKFLQESGYTPDEIASLSDPRGVSIARKAWLYDQMVAAQKSAKPVAPKTVQPGPSRQPQAQAGKQRDFARVRQSGRVEDAAAYIEHLLQE